MDYREEIWPPIRRTRVFSLVRRAPDCAINGGVFAGSYAVANGIAEAVPVDLTIAWCPPTPEQSPMGLLTLPETSSR